MKNNKRIETMINNAGIRRVKIIQTALANSPLLNVWTTMQTSEKMAIKALFKNKETDFEVKLGNINNDNVSVATRFTAINKLIEAGIIDKFGYRGRGKSTRIVVKDTQLFEIIG